MINPIHKEQVEFCLREFPDTRNSDLQLAREICSIYKIDVLMHDWVAMGCYITRVRRWYQNKGMYEPTDPAVKERRKQLAECNKEERIQDKNEVQEQSITKVL